MTGHLGTREGMWQGSAIPQFSFEMVDVQDPTIWILKYTTLGAAAEELARWENVGDTVGLVIESKKNRISLVMAYNFTRGRWFATDFYPHRKSRALWSRMDFYKYMTLMNIMGGVMVLACLATLLVGTPVFLPLWLFCISRAFKQYKTIHKVPYRVATAQPIANWITAHARELAASGNPSLDPSL